MDVVRIKRALLSVYHKAGLVPLAEALVARGVELVSSGGTAAALDATGLPVTAVADVTGAPEMLGGRVKTLHPRIHGGILADIRDPAHVADLEAAGVAPFELVVVNLYPFEATVAGGATDHEAVEQIDIGGPAMLRAAAKNHTCCTVLVSPADYAAFLAEFEMRGGVDGATRRALARKAFAHTAAYDAAIVAWLDRGDMFPETLHLTLDRAEVLRYGENPHQRGALYLHRSEPAWWREAVQHQGKALSWVNVLDADAAWRAVHAFTAPACVIVKHATPCGVATAADVHGAYLAANACDPQSAFGGVVAFNRALDGATAKANADVFTEVLIAPAVDPDAAGLVAARERVRMITAAAPHVRGTDIRGIDGGALIQDRDHVEDATTEEFRVVSRRHPTPAEDADLYFAWAAVAAARSNAVLLARDGAAVGIGSGQTDRVGAAAEAVRRAGARAGGAVAASDAFFPFRDGVDALAAAGVRAVVATGGSIRDEEVVAAADEHGMALVFAGRRHFVH